jgi:hypothetical protein
MRYKVTITRFGPGSDANATMVWVKDADEFKALHTVAGILSGNRDVQADDHFARSGEAHKIEIEVISE